MLDQQPDFFLGSSEHRGDWARARACWITGRLRTEDRRACVLVNVDPLVIGQQFGLGDKDLFSLILIPRRKGEAFAKTASLPMPVLVYRILNPDLGKREVVHDSDIKLSAWGEVYLTFEAAEQAANKAR
jgi:hypothetical protein